MIAWSTLVFINSKQDSESKMIKKFVILNRINHKQNWLPEENSWFLMLENDFEKEKFAIFDCFHDNKFAILNGFFDNFGKQRYFVTKIVLCEKKLFYWSRKLLKFEAEIRKFEKSLRSLEQFVWTVKGQNNFW